MLTLEELRNMSERELGRVLFLTTVKEIKKIFKAEGFKGVTKITKKVACEMLYNLIDGDLESLKKKGLKKLGEVKERIKKTVEQVKKAVDKSKFDAKREFTKEVVEEDFRECKTLEETKRVYSYWTKITHPDTKNGNEEAFKFVQSYYEVTRSEFDNYMFEKLINKYSL